MSPYMTEAQAGSIADYIFRSPQIIIITLLCLITDFLLRNHFTLGLVYLILSVHGKLAVQHQIHSEMEVKRLAGAVLFCKPQSKEVESSITSHIHNKKGTAEKPSASRRGLQFCLPIILWDTGQQLVCP